MSYCYDMIKKFRKEGNFCGLDKGQVSRLEAYLEIVDMLMKQHLDEKFIVNNFSLGAATPLLPIKDERRADGLSFITEQLKAGKKITSKNIQVKLHLYKTTVPDVQKSCKFTTSHTPVHEVKTKPEKCFSPQPGTIPETTAPPQPSLAAQMKPTPIEKEVFDMMERNVVVKPAPCLSGGMCPGDINHQIVDTVKGKMCNLWVQPINQIPAPGECYLDRKERLKGSQPEPFHKASEDPISGGTFVRPPPLKILAEPVSKQQAESWLSAIIKGYFTAKDQQAWEDLRRTGQLGDTDLEIFMALLWEASNRMGA